MTAPAVSEATFTNQVIEVAEMLGWKVAHFRPSRTMHGWRTAVQGNGGVGWPDLTIWKGQRLIFAELKSDSGRLTPEQAATIAELRETGAEAYIWRPEHFDAIVTTLRHRIPLRAQR